MELKVIQDKQKNKNKLFALVFSAPEGEEVLKDLSNFCGEFDPHFYPENARLTDFTLGRRSVMLYIREQLKG